MNRFQGLPCETKALDNRSSSDADSSLATYVKHRLPQYQIDPRQVGLFDIQGELLQVPKLYDLVSSRLALAGSRASHDIQLWISLLGISTCSVCPLFS